MSELEFFLLAMNIGLIVAWITTITIAKIKIQELEREINFKSTKTKHRK